jgi:hypothetical protein
MRTPARKQTASPLAHRQDLARILRDLDDASTLEILALSPTVAEIEEAALWAEGEDRAFTHPAPSPTGHVAQIVSIITRNDELDQETKAPPDEGTSG